MKEKWYVTAVAEATESYRRCSCQTCGSYILPGDRHLRMYTVGKTLKFCKTCIIIWERQLSEATQRFIKPKPKGKHHEGL